jgi:23S rRNA pseudouridine1911/1915/1917 synthase
MPKTEWGWQITPDELDSWILHHDDRLLVINKPGLVVCHPSKQGPWSSLVGACRERFGLERLHMPSRLDAETSGVVVVVKERKLGSRLQRAAAHRRIRKVYLALLTGELCSDITVDQPVGMHPNSRIIVRRGVVPNGLQAITSFHPIQSAGGCTFAEIVPRTGRLHQIRVHANWIGHPVVGDKIYGPDESLFLEFLEKGWTARHQNMLRIRRQALHAAEWSVDDLSFHAPLAGDIRQMAADAGINPVARTPASTRIESAAPGSTGS